MLITLAIIGIIAALTVPTLMRKYQEHQTVVAVKEVYSILSNALKITESEMGPVNTWSSNTDTYGCQNATHAKTLLSNVKKSKDCGLRTLDCFTEKMYNLNRTQETLIEPKNLYSSILSNGTSVYTYYCWSSAGVDAAIIADINGLKGPNQRGKDIFSFFILNNRLVPSGANIENMPYTLQNACIYSKQQTTMENGSACTAWVIYKGNMDYLRRQVSWDE